MDFARVLHDLTDYFASQDLRWAVVGGVAMAAYGLPRTTLDLDFLAERKDQDAIVKHLEGEGYRTLYRSEGYSNHHHVDAGRGRVDFVYVAGETARRLFAGVQQVRGPGGATIPVPSPEHLAAMKVHAMASDSARKALELVDVRRSGMSFAKEVEGLDPQALARDLPTTAEDVRALRTLRPAIRLEDLADWNWLSAGWQFGSQQRSGTSADWEPFELGPR